MAVLSCLLVVGGCSAGLPDAGRDHMASLRATRSWAPLDVTPQADVPSPSQTSSSPARYEPLTKKELGRIMEDPRKHAGDKVSLFVAVWPCPADQMTGIDSGEDGPDPDAFGCHLYDLSLGDDTFLGHVTADGDIPGYSEAWPGDIPGYWEAWPGDAEPLLGLFVSDTLSQFELIPGWIEKVSATVGGTEARGVDYVSGETIEAPVFYVDHIEFYRSPD